jgi:hypothetical protein
MSYKQPKKSKRAIQKLKGIGKAKAEISSANSLLRLLAIAAAAFPPPYFLVNSSFVRSRKATGICLSTDSTETGLSDQFDYSIKNNINIRKMDSVTFRKDLYF